MKFRDVLKEPIYNISNFLSISRVLLLPPFLFVDSLYRKEPQHPFWLPLLFALILLAVLTDYLDGLLARRLHQTTKLGQYLDPVCDKIVTIVALFVLTLNYDFPYPVLGFYIVREIAGVWGGTFLYFKRDIQGRPNQWGKWGVGIVSISVIWYMLQPWLRTRMTADHFLLHPEYSAYVLVLVLGAGIAAYARKYWRVVFLNQPPDKNT